MRQYNTFCRSFIDYAEEIDWSKDNYTCRDFARMAWAHQQGKLDFAIYLLETVLKDYQKKNLTPDVFFQHNQEDGTILLSPSEVAPIPDPIAKIVRFLEKVK